MAFELVLRIYIFDNNGSVLVSGQGVFFCQMGQTASFLMIGGQNLDYVQQFCSSQLLLVSQDLELSEKLFWDFQLLCVFAHLLSCGVSLDFLRHGKFNTERIEKCLNFDVLFMVCISFLYRVIISHFLEHMCSITMKVATSQLAFSKE